MLQETVRILDTYIADGAVPTYTSLDHVALLGAGRDLVIAVTLTQFVASSYLTVTLEQSADGKNFRSKFLTYGVGAPVPVPMINNVFVSALGPSSVTIQGTEPTRGLPNLKYSRLAITFMKQIPGDSARIAVTASVRGSPVIAEADLTAAATRRRAVPGSLAAHGEMAAEVGRLADAAQALHPAHRPAYLLRNLSHESKEHVRAVDRKLMALHPDVRKQLIAVTADSVRRAMALTGGRRKKEPVADCCGDDGASMAPKPAGSCGGGCGS